MSHEIFNFFMERKNINYCRSKKSKDITGIDLSALVRQVRIFFRTSLAISKTV